MTMEAQGLKDRRRYKFTVTAVGLPAAATERWLQALAADVTRVGSAMAHWDAEADNELVAWLQQRVNETSGYRSDTLPPSELERLTDRERLQLQRLDSAASEQWRAGGQDDAPLVSPLRVRLALLQGLNRRLRRVLPLVDLSSGHEWRAGAALRRLGHAIFFDLKAELLDAALRSSATQARHISLRLDHAKKTLSQVPLPRHSIPLVVVLWL